MEDVYDAIISLYNITMTSSTSQKSHSISKLWFKLWFLTHFVFSGPCIHSSSYKIPVLPQPILAQCQFWIKFDSGSRPILAHFCGGGAVSELA